jgi:hypothetical protein
VSFGERSVSSESWIGLPRRSQLLQETADYIEGFADWSHFASLTYAESQSYSTLRRHYRVLRSSIAFAASQEHVPLLLAVGPQANGVPHAHLLIAMPRHLAGGQTGRHLRRIWRLMTGGNAKVEPYFVGKGASSYLARHPSWELDYACPRAGACGRGMCCFVTSPPSLT